MPREVAKKQDKPKPELCQVVYLVWSGTRKHPNAKSFMAICEVIDGWAITPHGRKSTSARGFRFIATGLDYNKVYPTALMRASRENNAAKVEKLLAKGVDVNRKNKYGQTAFDIATQWGGDETARLLYPHTSQHETELIAAAKRKTARKSDPCL